MVLLLLIACAVAAADPRPAGKSAPTAARMVDLRQVFLRAYRSLVEANQRDLEANRKAAIQYRAQAADLTQRRGSVQKARELARLASLYDALADRNRIILDSLQQGLIDQRLRQAMSDVLALEASLAELTGQTPNREWLTFQEIARFEEAGGSFRAREPGTLPFLRQEWKVKGKVANRRPAS